MSRRSVPRRRRRPVRASPRRASPRRRSPLRRPAHRPAHGPAHALALAAAAVAVAIDGATGDLAVAAVVRPRPGIFSDAYYADWRAAFDGGACSQAGGVASTTETAIGGHDTFSATCSGGLITNHVHLVDRGLIVSISSLGQGQFGRLIVEGLR